MVFRIFKGRNNLIHKIAPLQELTVFLVELLDSFEARLKWWLDDLSHGLRLLLIRLHLSFPLTALFLNILQRFAIISLLMPLFYLDSGSQWEIAFWRQYDAFCSLEGRHDRSEGGFWLAVDHVVGVGCCLGCVDHCATEAGLRPTQNVRYLAS